MALTKEDLQAISNLLQPLKDDMQDMKDDMQSMKDDMQDMKRELEELKQRITNIEMTLENETNHNIQLLAENHINLVDKLNQAIRVQDKSILYEVQVSGLRMRVERLEQELADLKNKIA